MSSDQVVETSAWATDNSCDNCFSAMKSKMVETGVEEPNWLETCAPNAMNLTWLGN